MSLIRSAILAAFSAALGVALLAGLAAPSWWALPAILAGWYLADLVSGVVHMTMDYRPCVTGHGLEDLYFYPGSRESPEYLAMRDSAMRGINPFERIVYDFKNHHPRPWALGRRTMWRQIGSTVIAGTLPLAVLSDLAWLLVGVPGWAMLGVTSFLLGTTFAQYFHGTLHQDHPAAIVLAMRRFGLLMTPGAHQLHHDTLQRDFATNCGWSNPLVNWVFRRIRAAGGFADAGLEPHG